MAKAHPDIATIDSLGATQSPTTLPAPLQEVQRQQSEHIHNLLTPRQSNTPYGTLAHLAKVYHDFSTHYSIAHQQAITRMTRAEYLQLLQAISTQKTPVPLPIPDSTLHITPSVEQQRQLQTYTPLQLQQLSYYHTVSQLLSVPQFFNSWYALHHAEYVPPQHTENTKGLSQSEQLESHLYILADLYTALQQPSIQHWKDTILPYLRSLEYGGDAIMHLKELYMQDIHNKEVKLHRLLAEPPFASQHALYTAAHEVVEQSAVDYFLQLASQPPSAYPVHPDIQEYYATSSQKEEATRRQESIGKLAEDFAIPFLQSLLPDGYTVQRPSTFHDWYQYTDVLIKTPDGTYLGIDIVYGSKKKLIDKLISQKVGRALVEELSLLLPPSARPNISTIRPSTISHLLETLTHHGISQQQIITTLMHLPYRVDTYTQNRIDHHNGIYNTELRPPFGVRLLAHHEGDQLKDIPVVVGTLQLDKALVHPVIGAMAEETTDPKEPITFDAQFFDGLFQKVYGPLEHKETTPYHPWHQRLRLELQGQLSNIIAPRKYATAKRVALNNSRTTVSDFLQFLHTKTP